MTYVLVDDGYFTGDFFVPDGNARPFARRPLYPMADMKMFAQGLSKKRREFVDWLVENEIEHVWTIEEFCIPPVNQKFSRLIVGIQHEVDLVRAKLTFDWISLAEPIGEIIERDRQAYADWLADA